MKLILTFAILIFSNLVSAELCTAVLKDRRNLELEVFNGSSYSREAACNEALYNCHRSLSDAQSNGRYYDAFCEIKIERHEPRVIICQTDLVDYYNRVVRTFSAPGTTEWEACNTSDNFCKSELARHDSFGTRCVNRGLIDHRNDPRRPERRKTETCTADRRDPAGMFIQSYSTTSTGPIFSDVKGEACRNAINECMSDLRGRQTCQIRY